MPTAPQPACQAARRLAAAALAAAVLSAPPALAGPADACLPHAMEPVRVAAVRDARTLELSDGRLVRPAGIESFALIGAETERADALLAERLASRLAGKPADVHFVSERADRYGRRAALIATEAGLVQAELAAEGVALAFPEGGGAACMPAILAAEAAARRQGAGLWSQTAVRAAAPGALSSYLGGYVIFEGKVLSVGNRPRRTYLNFGRRWSEDVTVVIEARDRDSFGGEEALEALAGRRVRIRGFLEERGGPLVTARRTGQIEALEPLNGEGDGT
jgi:endonuclease YncB( thermonuclease family)